MIFIMLPIRTASINAVNPARSTASVHSAALSSHHDVAVLQVCAHTWCVQFFTV
jgi:hypothetical protein